MKSDRVVIWGSPGCDQCDLVELRLRLSGFLPEVKDLEKELELEPSKVRMEVMGLSSVVSDLEEMGYSVSWGVFSAEEVGAPHQRKRVFIMADSQGEGLERYDGLFFGRDKPRRDSREPQGQAGGGYICGDGRWPARPGQEQFDWEPPRVC